MECILFVSLVMHWLRSPLDLRGSPLSGQSDQGIGIHWILSTSNLAYIYKVYNICDMQYTIPNIYTQCTMYNFYLDKVTTEMISNLTTYTTQCFSATSFPQQIKIQLDFKFQCYIACAEYIIWILRSLEECETAPRLNLKVNLSFSRGLRQIWFVQG